MRANKLIVTLVVVIVILVGAVMFMMGRASDRDAAPAMPTGNAQAPVAPALAPQAQVLPPAEAPAQPAEASPATPNEKGVPPAATTSIPAAFLGEWNADPKDCGTGLSDSRVQVEPRRVRFHESEAQVKRVTIHNPRSVTIEGPFQGEGEAWDGRLRMDLSASGEAMTIGDLTRRRCPS
ncbi:MAG: hypothetical protein JWN69_2011 [Alphaproteobacteria bacterium]|nr:hypothetical protein [Alphaproteobacteria bacterium]